MKKEYFINKTVVLAHRGAPKVLPENTIPSFKKAVELGADVLEADIHFTKDKKFAVIHDNTLERTTDGKGRVADYTLAELKTLDAGYKFSADGGKTFPHRGRGMTIPSFEEMLIEFPVERLNIDLKSKSHEQINHYADIINRFGAEKRILTASKHTSILIKIRKLFPVMATSFGLREIVFLFTLSRLRLQRIIEFRGDALQIPVSYHGIKLARQSFVKRAHQKNLQVHFWTINNEDKMKELLAIGADGIFTEDAALLGNVLQIEKMK
ncbi:MAG: glycerophosphodiester phosphodiesterase [Spirochaetes bacterium]|jgi:glycerophosphoryl diester phosphodiesterase|nr:glycerophosphodiester phosphodiesterase [Spirochaetota bacterium]